MVKIRHTATGACYCLLVVLKFTTATEDSQQNHKTYYEHLKRSVLGETLRDHKELETLVEDSAQYLRPPISKQKRSSLGVLELGDEYPVYTEEDYGHDGPLEPIDMNPDLDAAYPTDDPYPIDDPEHDDYLLDDLSDVPLEPKSKYNDDRDDVEWTKRTREEHKYYREQYGYECYDKIEDQYFRKGDQWTTERNITGTSVAAYYECTCEGGDTGRYICSPTQVPCYSQYTGKYHLVGSEFGIEANNDEYVCYCYGGPRGRYECEEKVHGCMDSRYNHNKYAINEKFEQTREDNLTYDCECLYGSSIRERVIKCRLSRYCFINDEVLEIGDKFDIFDINGEVEHRCECKRNPNDSRSNLLHCQYVGSRTGQRGRSSSPTINTNRNN